MCNNTWHHQFKKIDAQTFQKLDHQPITFDLMRYHCSLDFQVLGVAFHWDVIDGFSLHQYYSKQNNFGQPAFIPSLKKNRSLLSFLS